MARLDFETHGARLHLLIISLERLLMRGLAAGLVLILITGCMHSGTPATSVTDNWIFSNCSSIPSVSKNACSEYRNCNAITSSRIGACRCEYSDGSVYQGVISKDKPWCGIQQDGSDTLVVRDGSATAEKTGVDWASTAVLVAGVAVAAAVLDDDDSDSSKRDDRTTKRTNESSSDLGERLLREQRERGVSGSGRVATSNSNAYPDITSSTYQNAAGQDLYTIQSSSSRTCHYTSAGGKVAISKLYNATCPTNVRAPSKRSSGVFDYSQMEKINVTGYKLSESRRYCTYSTPYGDIFLPKGEHASCPQSLNF